MVSDSYQLIIYNKNLKKEVTCFCECNKLFKDIYSVDAYFELHPGIIVDNGRV